jgi:glycosyltransferase involved in cell wall biosynthesis
MINDRKKIILAAGLFTPDIGGPATFAQILFSELVKDTSLKIKVVAYGEVGNEENITRISRRQNIFLRYLKYFLVLKKEIKKADVLYAFDLISVGVPCALIKLLNPRIRFIVRLGGDHQWERALGKGNCADTLEKYYTEKKFSVGEKLIFVLNNLVLKLADKIIFNSEYLQDIYLHKRGGVQAGKCEVIKNIQAKPSFLQAKTEKSESIKILYAGRLSAVKNLSRLVEATAIVKNDLAEQKIILEIVGEGPEEQKIKDLIKKNILTKEIILESRLSREKMAQKIAVCDLAILVSLSELNSNFFAEAYALSKPIIMTDKSEQFYLKILEPNIYYVDPLSVNDIAKKIKLAIQDLEKNMTPTNNLLSNIFWSKEKAFEAHKQLFKLSLQ